MAWTRVITLFQIFAILTELSAGVEANFIPEFQNDRGQSGNYVIYLCGSGRPNSPASMLQDVLPYIWRNLQDVLADVRLGTASTHGYRSFFKTDSNKQYVQAIFQAIAEGQFGIPSGLCCQTYQSDYDPIRETYDCLRMES